MSPPIPKHIAIIMDGNGRWAKSRGHHRTAGHIRGSKRVKEIVRAADALGVSYLTLFGFSSENWSRPPSEVSLLMRLLEKYLVSEFQEILDENVRVRIFGEVTLFSERISKLLKNLVEHSSKNTGLSLNFAFNYGGRQEILRAAQALVTKACEGRLEQKTLTELDFERELFSREVPDPDLIIRTSGEQRISNFLLWQCAYSEFYFTPTLWPDFSAETLNEAILDFQSRRRRFGGLDAPEEVRT